MNTETTPEARLIVAGGPSSPLGDVIQIDQSLIQAHLDQVVVKTVEQTLNAQLDAEADRLCGAKRYEHNAERTEQPSTERPHSIYLSVDLTMANGHLRSPILPTL